MSSFILCVLIFFTGLFIIVIIKGISDGTKEGEIIKNTIKDFSNIKIINIDISEVLYLDKSNEFFYFPAHGENPFVVKKRNVKDIVKCELIKNSQTVFTTNRGSQVMGALVGGALLGPVGAVIGGTTGSKTGTTKNDTYQIRIYYNTVDDPVDIIKPLNGAKEEDVVKCYATIEALINGEKSK